MTTQTVRLRRLSLVDEGEEVLVGDPEAGTFISIPAVGGVVIAALMNGATVEETARRAEEYAGEPVDVPAFVETLRELGFLDEDDDENGSGGERTPVATAPIQGRRWLGGLRPELARPLFGRVAWFGYGAAALFSLAALVLVPALRPDPSIDAFAVSDIGLGALLVYPITLVLAAVHEGWHWLAARALDLPARFGIDRRMAFLVFETDLSLLWSVPRKRRYGPLLAGLAIDSVLLAVVLGWRLVADNTLLGAVAYILVFQMAWQCMVFLRTDLYAVLITWLRCKDLWRVKTLLLRRAFGRLREGEAAELVAADPRDLRAGRWFRWLWLAGLFVVAAWLAFFALPVLVSLLRWTAAEVAAGPAAWRFWYALACTALMLGPWLAVAGLAAKSRLTRER
ncbi:hypothetical protein [Nonomuraea sp. NPDC049141]|uniref:hypothetical protein n=1 Tax=unclassified Nonomuraea TaxID=2593643 RepID=UPI0033DAF834